MMQIHPQARTTPAVRAEIARSTEPARVVAKRYGISDETVRKWRKRGEQQCQDRSSRPKRLAWRMSEEERAIICAVRRATGFPLDDLTFVLRHFLPHIAVSDFVRRAKGRSSRKIQQEFEHIRKRYWGQRFWQRGYFSTTSGNITDDVILNYLDKHTKPNKAGFSPKP